ncbi:hypothetical protein [Lederbergia panacisoli]|uniref:hypothetical protein n=1 Tax=Lederbergia panacisoli TaxID=1255251 RepID=UPI00214C65C4|nr:hypothetical protein [Lederbergia panacisoli]MCR2822053.1 hypothetical protein [Lederbergia panacisoli]
MPSISKIRFTNVVYEDGLKRYNDEIFKFDGYNGAILLENGGGKTVFIQTVLQAIIPHTNLSDRKIKQTLQLDNYPAHIAIEWILSEKPRRYLVTCVSLFLTKDGLGSYRYVYPYMGGDQHGIENIPFVRKDSNRPADRGEISDYYQQMTQQFMNAHTFPTIKEFQQHIQDQYHIITNEWESIVKINSTEGGVEAFFDECKQTNQLFDRLLIPTVEGAIAGHDQNTFVDTFEKHRSSFKLYKELKGQIEENKAIEEELNRYVLTYGGLHEQQQAYEQKKQHAKAVLNLIHRQEQEHQAALETIQLKIEELEIEEKNQLKKLLSLDIHKEQSVLETLKNELKEYEQKLGTNKEELSQAINTFYSLKYAELKQDLKEEQDRIQALKNQLETLEKDEEIHEIKEKLDENSQELLGYFLHELEESDKRKHGLQIEKQPIEEHIEQLKIQNNSQGGQLAQAKSDYDKMDGKMEALDQQMIRIHNRILSNPEQESVKENVLEWEKNFAHLDEQIVQLKNDHKQLVKMIKERKELKETIAKQKEEKENARIKEALEIEQIENEHAKVKEELASLRKQWMTLDSIYLKQDSLKKQIDDDLLRLNKERDNCLYKERLAHRFKDDYGTQDLFFADPYIEKQLKQWSNQFNLLETGVQFIQSLDDSAADKVKNYPLWPTTLITTEDEQEELELKIKRIDKELQFPIEVITIDKARALVQEENVEAYPIVPNHWRENWHLSLFQEWKQTMNDRAVAATEARNAIEAKINVWKRGAENMANFLRAHPYSEYQERKEHLSDLVNQMQDLHTRQIENETKITEGEERLSTGQERINAYEQEYNGLQGKIEAAYEYLRLEKDKVELVKVQEKLARQINDYKQSVNRIAEQIKRFEEEKRRLEDEERDENHRYHILISNELYLEVNTFRPKYTDKAINILKHEREELKLSLRRLSSTRNEIQIKLDHAHENSNRISVEIQEMLADHGPLDEEMVFSSNGKEQIVYYRRKMKELEKAVDEASEQFARRNEKKIRQEEALEIASSKFNETFANDEPETFAEPLSEVQKILKDEKKRLRENHDYLEREQKRVNVEYDSIKTAFHELDRFEEAHHFKGPSVTAGVLSEGEIQDFTYERVAFVQNVTDQLKQGKAKVSKEWEKVGRAKESFKSFCKNKITNVKMREMARQGIDNKQTYKKVVEFQTHMQKRIQTAIKYNEASIINHDKQLEQFVTHINSHLYTLAGELELIPKKTKVKIEDNWKEIYKFSIPEWTQEDGKSRIRNHIDWILEQLESKKYLTAEGTEDYGKVRREIETWLQSKQLLRVVMNNEMMKVSCRKVTNDNQITTRSYSWEQSNVWSGGEKWSKNMTLFLGILNYVAEKQKHIEPNMKRHRVVIMDNPFGKASSDHVLNPVFFIAEQLGFQIIALTAHAEGKFLRDYFPVIYSCRLRKAANSNKQIMTTVKQLHQAYFQDHEPQALERLGEVEQMALF